MLTCVIDALEGRGIAVVDIPNTLVQTVVEDKEHRVIVCIIGPLVDILLKIAPHVYGPCVCVFLAPSYGLVTVMHKIPISSAHLLTSLPYPRAQ
jgi:hypothetical protein